MATYQIPIVLDVEANSYEEAMELAIDFNGQLTNSDPTFDNIDITSYVQNYFEHDNIGNRVLYLHPEKHSADYDPDADADDD
jgi:hypothetical protein